jgi:hypothetical protein
MGSSERRQHPALLERKDARWRRGMVGFPHLARDGRMTVTIGRRELIAALGGAPVLVPRRYVAEGNFVLALVEARTEPPTANYDLFRVQNGKIAEHWDVLSPIPPRNQWKNANGPF